MTTSTVDQPAQTDDGQATEAFVERLFEATLGALDLYAVHLGDRLGLYAALHERGPSTSAELAAQAGVGERYAREWLEQQAVSDILTVDDASLPAAERRYALPDHVVPVLLDPTSPAYLAPAAGFVAIGGQVFDRLVDAYRSGAGVPFSAYPAAFVELQGAFNRPAFLHELPGWLEALGDVHTRLLAGPARVADVACGLGWSTQEIARHYPQATVDGFDIDDAAVALARRNVVESGVADRVRFEVSDLAEPTGSGYDLITMFEALHDLSHPVEVLTTLRRSLAPDGVVLIADERAAEQFTVPGDLFERLFYGSSLLVCLPTSLADGGVGTGAAIRPSTVRQYADEAGFGSCQVVDIEHPTLRFYLLRP